MSRARRIVLAMYGHTKPTTAASVREWAAQEVYATVPYFMTSHGCYEAMDAPDEATHVAPRIVLGGNYGMPCA